MNRFTITDEKPDVIDLHGNPASLPAADQEQPAPQPSISPDIQKEISDLLQKGIPVEKILKAIDEHPEIADKVAAKHYATNGKANP